MTRPTTFTTISAVLAVASLLTACGTTTDEGGDKAGNETVTMTLATIDKVDNNGQSFGPRAFLDGLTEVSEGGLDVVVDLESFARGGADDESALVEAIAAGEVDGGWPSVRAFSAAGIDGLDVVEAPLTLTNYDAVKDLVTSATAGELLARLDGTGLVGLALAVGPLRRPFSADAPLVDPTGWEGLTIRSYNSPVQDATIRALGAEPMSVGLGWSDLIRSGDLDGVELDVAQYWETGTAEAPNVPTNVVLWPKVFVLAVSQQFWDSLSGEQQGWVRQAAEQARDASVEATYDEQALVSGLCERGLTLVPASEEQLDAYREAVQPVLSDIADDPLLAEIQQIAAAHQDPESLEALPGCAGSAAARPDDPRPAPATSAGLPNGTYRVEITGDEVREAGFSNGPGHSGIWTLIIEDDLYRLACVPADQLGIDCGNHPDPASQPALDAGTVAVDGDALTFTTDPQVLADVTGCAGQSCVSPVLSWTATWERDGDWVTFRVLDGTNIAANFEIEPWQQIN